MSSFNDIGIDSKLDWKRIQKLLKMGLIAVCMVWRGYLRFKE